MTALRGDGILAALLLLLLLCHVTKATARQGALQGRKLLVCNAAAIRQCPACCESVPNGQSQELVGTFTSSSSSSFGTTKQSNLKTSTSGGNTGASTSSALPMEAVQSQSQTKPRLMDSSSVRGTITSTASG